jgi:hypothetical protein
MKRLLSILPILAGCATDPATVGLMMQAQTEAAKRPTLAIDCPAGCSVSYTDPRDRLTVKIPSNGWDAAMAMTASVERLVSGAVMPAAVAAIAIQGIKGAGHDTVSTTTTNTSTNTTSSTSTVVDDHSTTSNITTTTTSTDSHDTDSHDATATPTVVNQPPPVVVTQPAPIIVDIAP